MNDSDSALHFDTSPSQLLLDLYRAYKDARRHKRKRDYQLRFERNLENELVRLRDAILSKRYKPRPSTCFIIHDPKMREVFAAQFRDRVVHHLLYNYIAPLLIPTFIRDSYSCIPGRGTHDGIFRLEEKVRDVSHNYSRPCYILKLDIKGYFMHINRSRLLEISIKALEPFRAHIDFPLVKYLLEVIIMDDPTLNCRRRGLESEWNDLPASKSLFHSPRGCGLPIGNLTSLRKVVSLASDFLSSSLGLSLSQNKISICSAYRGVEFLGAYLKPFRRYIANKCLWRMEAEMRAWKNFPPAHPVQSINSYLGLTSHYRAYNVRLRWVSGPMAFAFKFGYFTDQVQNPVLKNLN